MVARRSASRRGHRPAGIAGLLVLLAAGAAAFPGGASAALPASPLTASAPDAVPGQVLVRFASGTPAGRRAAARRRADTSVARVLPASRLQLLEVDRGQSVEDAVAALERRPEVRFAQPNYVRHATALPPDARFGELWGLRNTGQKIAGVAGTPDADIDAPEAWDVTTGSRAVIVAVVDSGIAAGHPDLAPNTWSNAREIPANGVDDDDDGFVDDVRGWDFVDRDADPTDYDGHGTHVSGTIGGASDPAGIVGVSPVVSLMALRVLDGDGNGTDAAIAEAFAYAGAHGAKVVNASFGGPGEAPAIHSAIAAAPDTLFAIAAGNDGVDDDVSTFASYPCVDTSPNVVCVAASDQDDALAGFSSYGARSVDLAAPGVSILSSWPGYGAARFADGFEAPLGDRWRIDGTHATWARTTAAAASGAASLTDSPDGPYQNFTDSSATPAAPVDLTGGRGCRLFLQARVDLEPSSPDRLYVQARRGAGSWDGRRYGGSTDGAFVPLSVDLSALDGAPDVGIRLRLATDESIVADGVYVDDVAVRCLAATAGAGGFELLDGTSMAAPHVAGAAALVWAAHPDDDVARVKRRLLENVDPVPSLAGKVASGGRLNVAKAVGPAQP